MLGFVPALWEMSAIREQYLIIIEETALDLYTLVQEVFTDEFRTMADNADLREVEVRLEKVTRRLNKIGIAEPSGTFVPLGSFLYEEYLERTEG